MKTSTKSLTPLFVGVALAVVLAWFTAGRYLFAGDPDHYVTLARSLATGGGYRVNGRPEVKFPPGFPLVLTPAVWLFGGDFAGIARWAAAIAGFALPVTFWFLRRRGMGLAFPAALATVFSASFLSLALGNPMSEPTFLILSVGLLIWGESWNGTPSGTLLTLWMIAGLLLLLFTLATRTVGLAALGAVFVGLIQRRRRQAEGDRGSLVADVLLVSIGTAYALGWFAWSATQRQPRYAGEFMDSYLYQIILINPHNPGLGQVSPIQLVHRFLNNIVVESAHAGELLMQIPWIKPVWYSPLTVVPFGLIAVGWWQDAKIARGLAAPYFVFYLAIILLWPFDEGTRFLIPISPLLWLYVFSGAAAVVDSIRRRRRWPTLAVRTLSAIALAGSLVSILAQQDHASRQDVGAVIVWTALLGAMVTIRPGFALQVLAATPKRAATWIPLATTLYVLIGVIRVAPTAWAAVTGAPPSEPTALALSRAAEWVNTNTSPCAVIQATLPERMNFATGRKSVIFPVASSQDALRQVTERFTPNYLIVLDSTRYPYFSPSDQQRLAMMQSLFPGRLQEVHRFEGGAVYFMDWRPF